MFARQFEMKSFCSPMNHWWFLLFTRILLHNYFMSWSTLKSHWVQHIPRKGLLPQASLKRFKRDEHFRLAKTLKRDATGWHQDLPMKGHQCPNHHEKVQRILGSNLPQRIPSKELTYPTLGKGKSSSKCHFGGICWFPGGNHPAFSHLTLQEDP